MNKQQSKYFYTASLFNEALIELLNKKEIEYISVKEICIKAGVNRSTFYLHYENIYDLLNETLEYINNKFLLKVPDNGITKDIINAPIEELIFINEQYLIPYLEFIKENKNIYLASYSNPKNMKSLEAKKNLDTNIIKFIKERIQVENLIKELIEKVSLLSDLKEVYIRVNICNNSYIGCDFKWQVEAISNIIKNCIEYSKRNSFIDILVENKYKG